jgi:hypothetical protein
VRPLPILVLASGMQLLAIWPLVVSQFCVGNEGRMNQPYTLKPAWLLGCEGYDGFLPTCYV